MSCYNDISFVLFATNDIDGKLNKTTIIIKNRPFIIYIGLVGIIKERHLFNKQNNLIWTACN